MSENKFANTDLRVTTYYESVNTALGSIPETISNAYSLYSNGISNNAALSDKVSDLKNFMESINTYIGGLGDDIGNVYNVHFLGMYNHLATELNELTKAGFPGAQGGVGSTGRQGQPGPDGDTGLKGDKGQQGRRGPAGIAGDVNNIEDGTLPIAKLNPNSGQLSEALIPTDLSFYAKPIDLQNLNGRVGASEENIGDFVTFSFQTAMFKIKEEMNSLKGSYSFRDVANAFARAIGREYDSDFINNLVMDGSSLEDPAELASKFLDLTNTNDPYLFAARFYYETEIYSSFNGLTAFAGYLSNSGFDSERIIQFIQTAANDARDLREFGQNILNYFNAGSDSNLANIFEFNAFSAGMQLEGLQTALNNLQGDDPAIIAANLFQIMWNTKWTELMPLTTALMEAFADNGNYAMLTNDIISAVSSLQGEYLTLNNVALALVSGIGASNNRDLINKLQLVLNAASVTASDIQNSIKFFGGSDPATLALSLISMFGESGNIDRRLSSQGAILLGRALMDIDNTGPTDIVVNIKTAIANLSGDFDNRDIALAIAEAIGQLGNNALIQALRLDFDSSFVRDIQRTPTYIQANSALISGENTAEITKSIYTNLVASTGWLSIDPGAAQIAYYLDNYRANLIEQIMHINDRLGVASLDSDEKDITGAINQLVFSKNEIKDYSFGTNSIKLNTIAVDLTQAVNEIQQTLTIFFNGDYTSAGARLALENLKVNLNKLTGDSTPNEFALAIASALNQANNSDFVNSLETQIAQIGQLDLFRNLLINSFKSGDQDLIYGKLYGYFDKNNIASDVIASYVNDYKPVLLDSLSLTNAIVGDSPLLTVAQDLTNALNEIASSSINIQNYVNELDC